MFGKGLTHQRKVLVLQEIELSNKKQEEYKKLEEADDNSYLNAPWADSGALKRSMHGTGNIGFR